MTKYEYAKIQFDHYIKQFDLENDKIKLKWQHTFGVVACVKDIALHEGLNQEDTELAKIIALLHDIGRFEQLKRYNSFNDKNIDHALLACDYLFKENHIIDFIQNREEDDIIYQAIKNHNLFKIKHHDNKRIMLHIHLIRDADKLDNYRVKNIESFETMLDVSKEYMSTQTISKSIFESMMNHQLIYSEDRKTALDMWLSFIAFMFDLNFKSSFLYLEKTQYVYKNLHRIDYKDEKTKQMIAKIEKSCEAFIQKNTNA